VLGSLLSGAAYAVLPYRAVRLEKARLGGAIILGANRKFLASVSINNFAEKSIPNFVSTEFTRSSRGAMLRSGNCCPPDVQQFSGFVAIFEL